MPTSEPTNKRIALERQSGSHAHAVSFLVLDFSGTQALP